MATQSEKIKNLEEKINSLEKLVQKLNHALFGNGAIGLIEQIKNTGKQYADLKKTMYYIIGLLLLVLGRELASYLLKLL